MNFKILLIIFLATFYQCQVFAQDAPTIEWERSFGIENSEIAYDIQVTQDSGFIIVGSIELDGVTCGDFGDTSDVWIIKTNQYGILEWEKKYGGSQHDEAIGVVVSSDGSFLVLITSFSNDGSFENSNGNGDFWLIKLSSNGEEVWRKNYGGSEDDVATDLISTSDGGFALLGITKSADGDVSNGSGNTNFDVWLLKVNSNGVLEWQKNYDGNGLTITSNIKDDAQALLQTSDGGFIIGGTTTIANNSITESSRDLWIIRTNNLGNEIWSKTFGGTSHEDASDIIETDNGDFIIAGGTRSFDGDILDRDSCLEIPNHVNCLDFWILKIDALGNFKYAKNFGGSSEDKANVILKNSENSYILSGYAKSIDGDIGEGNINSSDIWINNIIDDGNNFNLGWTLNLGSTNRDRGYSLKMLSDSTYISAGYIEKDDGNVGEHFGCRDIWISKLSYRCQNNNLGKPIIIGDTITCEGESIFIELGNNPPTSGNITYHWQTPTGVVTTQIPSLELANASPLEDSGNYRLFIEQDACFSALSAPLNISILTSSSLSPHYIFEETTSENDVGSDTSFFTNLNGCDSLIITVTSLEIPISTQDLVAYYNFEGDAQDKSGWNNHGFINRASLVEDRNNKVNGAYALDGLEDYIWFHHQDWINFSNLDTFSITLWVAISDQEDIATIQNEILTKWEDNTDSYPYTIRVYNRTSTSSSPGTIIVGEWNGPSCPIGADVKSNGEDYIDEEFHHIVYQKEGLDLFLYVDNELMGVTLSQDTCEIENELPVYIGRRGNDTGDRLYFKGTIDEVMIFRRSLSDLEIETLFNDRDTTMIMNAENNFTNKLLTPNNLDGKNDFLIFNNLSQFPNNSISIINRYGAEVFEGSPYKNNWDGTYKGASLPDGTYYYYLDLGDGTKPKKGYITILSK